MHSNGSHTNKLLCFWLKSYFNINTFTLHSEKQGDENECQLYDRHWTALNTE